MVTRAAPGGRRTRRRRSQEERREATRGAVLDATVECLAARSDRQLLREVSRITTQFTDTVIATYRELFAEAAAPNVRFDLVPAFTFAFLQGLALDRIAIADDQRVSELIAVLKDLAAVVL